VSRWNWQSALLVLVALVCSGFVLWRLVRRGETSRTPLGPEFRYDASVYKRVDPALVLWKEADRIDVAGEKLHCVAVGPDDAVRVGVDLSVQTLGSSGVPKATVALSSPARAIAIGADGALYVALETRIATWNGRGEPGGAWRDLGEVTRLSSIAVTDDDVFAADSGQRTVWQFSRAGELRGRIGGPRDEDGKPGFVVPSPYLDVAMAPDGVLRVVNPGLHRIEAWTVDGDRALSWGRGGAAIEGFIGCCNPVHAVVLSDGAVVTSEKGVARVKVYDSDGIFQNVVAGPNELGDDGSARDLAVDSKGRVIVLDPATRSVRIYVRKPEAGAAPSADEKPKTDEKPEVDDGNG